jgi:hypothetical protein
MANVCNHPDCTLPISGRRVLCSKHWREIGEKMRAKIQAVYRTRLLNFDVREAARVIVRDYFKK